MWSLISCILSIFLFAGSIAAQTTRQDTLRELMRRIDILTEELEARQLHSVSERRYESRHGLGPAASQIYHRRDSGVSLAGYGEVLYENFAEMRDDGQPAGRKDRIDFLRNVIYLGVRFNERFLINTEIEYEHAKSGDGEPGEVAMEFGYVDASLSRSLIFRAGMVLMPVGIVNEYHEPGTFFSTLRTETESAIIPTTWRGIGAGVLGNTAAGLSYKLYLVEGLNAAGFGAGGIRGGRQSGAKAVAENLALSGRLEYAGVPGLNIGASFFAGRSGQGLQNNRGDRISAFTSVVAAHGLFARRGFEARLLYARTSIGDVAGLNTALGLQAGKSIGERQHGFYATLGYDILQHLTPGSRATLQPFIQYETLDTQARVPAGFTTDPARKRETIAVGLLYKPVMNIGFKIDYWNRKSDAGSAVDQLNLAVTYFY